MLYKYDAMIEAMTKIVEDNMEAYKEDFYDYDMEELKDIDPFVNYVWIVREHGTHFTPNPEYADAVLKVWKPDKIAIITRISDTEYSFKSMTPEEFDAWSTDTRDAYLKRIRDELHNRTIFDTSDYITGSVWYSFGYIYVNCNGTVAYEDNIKDLYKIIKSVFHMTAYSFYTYTKKRKDYEAA